MGFHLKKKLLFISDHGDPLIPLGSKQAGGQNNYVKNLVLELDRQGYQIDVVTHWSDASRPMTEKIGTIGTVHRFTGGQKGFVDKNELFNLLPTIYQQMEERLNLAEYDVVHTHYWLSGLLALKLKQSYTFHWVHTNHSLAIAKEQGTGLVDERRKSFEKLILTNADSILATTKNEKHQIEELLQAKKDIYVVPIGVASIYLTETKQNNKLNYPYYFYAGRLEESKGIFDLAHAFRDMLNKNLVPSNVKLVIAGGSEDTVDLSTQQPKDKKLKRAIKGIEDRIKFLGPKKEKELQSLYANAIVTIMPSHYESFGMVAAEAQACGCPVIATRVGGLKDVVKSGITGFHFPKENVKQLSEQMAYFLDTSPQVVKMRKAAKKFAVKEYNWSIISRKLKGLYNT